MTSANSALLDVTGLGVVFDSQSPTAHCALEGVSLSIREGEILALVGESGSGKTVFAHSVLGLLPGNAKVTAGRIFWKGTNLLALSEPQFRRIRGKEIAMIFQDPQASLNPVYPVGKQIEWVLQLHRRITGDEAKAEVLRLFENVKLRDPVRCVKCYPHELSGGMCQRVMIALALAGNPSLLIADEPTSALDVSVAAEIVSLLAHLQKTLALSILVITHDLSIASRLADRIAVLDHSHLVEDVSSDRFLSHAQHAASRKLIDASRFMGAALYATLGTSELSLTKRV